MNEREIKQRLSQIKLFLCDMDGTIYLSGVPLPGAIEAVGRMRERARVCYLTNNSSLGAADYCVKLNRLGFPAKEGDVFTSGQAACVFL
ncbi:MAG: HAD family hydrolase, partial [Firmicutes bacterium]|nr:HAD family hydrolase [Bacillota bacterium]